jgi:hypothetical protein
VRLKLQLALFGPLDSAVNWAESAIPPEGGGNLASATWSVVDHPGVIAIKSLGRESTIRFAGTSFAARLGER